jgi:peptidoglycan-associated lipoprotein
VPEETAEHEVPDVTAAALGGAGEELRAEPTAGVDMLAGTATPTDERSVQAPSVLPEPGEGAVEEPAIELPFPRPQPPPNRYSKRGIALAASGFAVIALIWSVRQKPKDVPANPPVHVEQSKQVPVQHPPAPAPVQGGNTQAQSTVLPPDREVGTQRKRQAEQPLWESIKDSRDPTVFTDYLRRYPEGQFATAARQKYRDLTVAGMRAEMERTLAAGQWDVAEGKTRDLLRDVSQNDEIRGWQRRVAEGRRTAEASKREQRIKDLRAAVPLYLQNRQWSDAEQGIAELDSLTPGDSQVSYWRGQLADGRKAATLPPPPSIVQFVAEPNSIQRGQTCVLRWRVSGPVTGISIDGVIDKMGSGANTVQVDGSYPVGPSNSTTYVLRATGSGGTVQNTSSQRVLPNDSTTYTLTATGPGGNATRSATVTVTALPPPPPPPTPVRVPIEQRLFSEVHDAFFDYDKSDLRADAREALTRDASTLKSILADFPGAFVGIEGHCEERGAVECMGLADRRATAARNFLVRLGVSADRLKTIAYGKERPQCMDVNESCRQKNRRVHFTAGQ